jgi:hypothetical protein
MKFDAGKNVYTLADIFQFLLKSDNNNDEHST